MRVLPAIDLRGGRQVGLMAGRLDQARTYGEPGAFAAARAAEGYLGLHVVDLDGAAAGAPRQLASLAAIRAAAPDLFIEAGGGVRSAADAEAVLAAGADRVVVGTAAVRPLLEGGPPALLRDLLRTLGPEAVAVAADVRVDGASALALEAWRESARVDLRALAHRLGDLGVRHIVYTDVGRDGSLGGVRTAGVRALTWAGLSVTAGGGVGSRRDLTRLAAAGAAAAVAGRAFHSGRFRPPPRLERPATVPS
jgi:phosphoribosylformimino-5-aminoimidazole carboxamide ribotide isomerase